MTVVLVLLVSLADARQSLKLHSAVLLTGATSGGVGTSIDVQTDD